jgi:hypothetical protein
MTDAILSQHAAPRAKRKGAQQYLERYAEPEAVIAHRLTGNFGHALVVPAYDESDDLIRALQSVPPGPDGDVLVILVVNAPPEAAAWVHDRNGEVLDRLRKKYGIEQATIDAATPARVFRFRAGSILHIDRASPGHFLPKGQGVGWARKIGFDIALGLHQAKRLASPWIHSTDADVLLPRDYFDRASSPNYPPAAALVYPFAHRGEDDIMLARAIQLYEIALRYYVLGLTWAGSPYAHHTIGSTLAIDALAYAKVRGVPKRTAAEDFYLLGKVAKVGRVLSLAGMPIALSGRVSRRVPFGTGPAVERIARDDHFTLYHPHIFAHLAVWLGALAELAHTDGPGALATSIAARCRKRSLDPSVLLELASHPTTESALAAARRHSKSRTTFALHIATWFDAFRTLKLVHTLEARGLTPRPWLEALREAPFARESVDDVRVPTVDGFTLARILQRLASFERIASPTAG